MAGGDWWTEDYGGQQTGEAPEQFDQGGTTYAEPGQPAPIDQYNFVPDANAPGGFATYGPGAVAPFADPTFSNTSGGYPDDQQMAQAIANSNDFMASVNAFGDASTGLSGLGQRIEEAGYAPGDFTTLDTSGTTATPAAGGGNVAPAGGGGGGGPMGPGSEPFNYQRSYLEYLLRNMQLTDERAADLLAFEKVKQQWLQTYQYLGLLSSLRGPGNIFRYLRMLNATPGGVRDIVNSAMGAFQMPRTSGPTVSVGGYNNPATIESLLEQMNDPNFGSEAQNLTLPLPNQLSAQNLARMNPSQLQFLLGAYEQAGYYPEDVMSIFRSSLPAYGNQATVGNYGFFR